MPVCPALGDEPRVLPRLGEDEVAFRSGEAERLVEIDVDSAPHRHHGGEDMLVVRRLDDNGVDLAAHLVEHVLVRREAPRLGVVLPFSSAAGLGNDLVEPGEARWVWVDNRDEVLAQDAVDHVSRLKAAPDQRDAYLRAARDLPCAA